MSHTPISPAILYWGTPVVLISTTNPDGSANIGPMSSAFWLADRCMLGLAASSQTTANLLRTKQCVLNLASDDMTCAVNALARTTGTKDVPVYKAHRGYVYEKDKFGIAGLTPETSSLVQPPRIRECKVQMEAELVGKYDVMEGRLRVIEVRILKTYVVDELRLEGHANRIDPDAWHPMIMSFQHFYGLRNGQLVKSRLADIEEELYRVPKADGEKIDGAGPPGGARS